MMKQIITVNWFFLLSVFCSAQDSVGIRFRMSENWNDVLRLAKESNKLVFVDIYTSWCGPCKRMSQDVFTQKNVGEKYNTNFVNYKVDAEKGEGIELAKKYNIKAYPSYLFVDGNGTLFYTVTSYMPAAQFIQQASVALAEFKDPRPLPVWDKEFEAGRSDPSFLLAYLQKRTKLKKDNTELMSLYFSKIPKADWITHDNMLLVTRNPVFKINSALFITLSRNIELADRVIKDEQFPGSIHDVLYDIQLKALHHLIESNDIKKFEREFIKCNHIMPEVISAKPWFTRPKDDYWRLYFYKNTGRHNQFIQLAQLYYEKEYMQLSLMQIAEKDSVVMEKALSVYKDTSIVKIKTQPGLVEMTRQAFLNYFRNQLSEELVAASQIVLLHSNSSAIDAKALAWAAKSYEVKSGPETMYVLGLLHYKANNIRDALKCLRMAFTEADDLQVKTKIQAAITAAATGEPFQRFRENIVKK